MNWAALGIALIVSFYWARVLRLVFKTRRQTGGSANLFPADPVERFLKIIWIPVVAIWIANPWLCAAIEHSLPVAARPLYYEPSTQAAALLACLVCLAGTMVCWRRMGKSWRMGINPSEKTTLVVAGPYAYIRHPIYALSSFMMVASAIAVPTPLMFAAGVVHLSLLQWEARREERYLLTVHGEPYAHYVSQVGGFLPRSLSPYQPGR